ncbi:MAG TPA: hypothetical protein VGH54_04165 [Mycobacterium sp.]|jgi:hypothetical protein|uniref:hypothetical protein n=1 Tax=Mycobacterium sp. TaxID=1785 RepID=UPI002F41AA6E
MTTTPNVPFVPLPPGVEDYDAWHDWNYEYRLIWGAAREVQSWPHDGHVGDERSIIVAPCAAQLPDGSVATDERASNAPVIVLQGKNADGALRDLLTVPASRARELASALLEAADELDGWAGR